MIKKIIFTGDIMSHMPQNNVSWKGDHYDYSAVFSRVSGLFKSADYVIGNLETPVAGEKFGYTSEKTVFNTPIQFVKDAIESGISIFTLANNHCFDKGIEGLEATIRNVRGLGARTCGCYLNRQESLEPLYIELSQDCVVAILSYTYGTNSKYRGCQLTEDNDYLVDLFRKQDPLKEIPSGTIIKARRIIKKLLPRFVINALTNAIVIDCVKDPNPSEEDLRYLNLMTDKIGRAQENADITVMCMHSGGQFNDVIGAYTKNLVKTIMSNKCDLIVGNHPHDILPFELMNNKPVAYSLGNFCWTPKFSTYRKKAYSEYSLLLNLYIDTEKKSIAKITATVLKCVQQKDGNSVIFPLKDLYNQSNKTNRKKMEKDFHNVIRRIGIDQTDVDINMSEILLHS